VRSGQLTTSLSNTFVNKHHETRFSVSGIICNIEKGHRQVFRRVRSISQSDLASLRLSVRPHVNTSAPTGRFSLNLISEDRSKMYREKFKFHYNLTRIRGTYMKTYANLYLAEVFLE
jgi:hypothetical protein